MTEPKLKIAFLSGPANVPEIYREWSAKEQQEYFGTDYLKQFLQVANDLDATSRVVTWYGDKPGEIQLGDFTFDNRPITEKGGWRYYLDHIVWHARLIPSLIRFKPDVLMLTGNQNFWWVLAPVRWLTGAQIVISYHAVLWPQYGPVSRVWRTLLQLNKKLILRHAKGILETSHAIRSQIEGLLGEYRGKVPIYAHLPTYSPTQFAPIAPPPSSAQRPFRTFFLGRTETNKGIYDIVEIARRLEQERPGQYRFDMCGSGGELANLRARVSELGLEQAVHVHGYAPAETVQELLSASHACIVPTRTNYEAGFEMTCSESILSGRPLVTSIVCPAIEYMREATLEAQPDDIDSYYDAIVRLSDDPELYDRLQRACGPLQEQFYDRNNSWYSAMRRAIEENVLTSPVSSGARAIA